jgi:hypothetical protein
MTNIGGEEVGLFIWIGILRHFAQERCIRIVVVVAPFSLLGIVLDTCHIHKIVYTYEMVRKLQPRYICICVLEVNDNELLVFVLGSDFAFILSLKTKDITILRLCQESVPNSFKFQRNRTSLWANTNLSLIASQPS